MNTFPSDGPVSRRDFLRVSGAIATVPFVSGLTACHRRAPGPVTDPEVLVYGATPAGIAASVAAARSGRTVTLIEPTRRIGGMVTNGLSHPDFRTLEGLTGLYLELTQRAKQYYVQTYGENSPEVETSFEGTHAEPHVNLLIFERMLAEHEGIHLRTQHPLRSVATEPVGGTDSSLTSATFEGPNGQALTIRAEVYVDATYEGDLMAQSGVEYRVGREAQNRYNESLAPKEADSQVQGYNFRLTFTTNPDLRVRPEKPEGYDREYFAPILDLIEAGAIEEPFVRWDNGLFKAQTPKMPGDKYDINDISENPVRQSLPSINDAWPDGDAATRREIFREHVRHQIGMLYFVQNDPAVPEDFQTQARKWGLSSDEFTDSAHLPVQLYVREARRMVGQHVYTQSDAEHSGSGNRARAPHHNDAIAMGEYGFNCHGTGHEGPRFGGKHTGEFYRGTAPYQVPYGVLLPRRVDNLLVPGAVSASHIGFSALRYEYIWTSLGEAAGHAAHLAIQGQDPLDQISVPTLQRQLHEGGTATIYVSDVRPEDEDFAAVQWWGTQGGLHGLHARPDDLRGESMFSQYHAAYPGHEVEMETPLGNNTRRRWRDLVRSLDLPEEALSSAETRGDFIRTAHQLHQESQ